MARLRNTRTGVVVNVADGKTLGLGWEDADKADSKKSGSTSSTSSTSKRATKKD